MSDMPREVQEAYERAARKQLPHCEPLPPWETLSLELREAFAFVLPGPDGWHKGNTGLAR